MIRVGLVGPADREELQRIAIRLEERSAEGVFVDTRRPLDLVLDEGREEACGVPFGDLAALFVVDLHLPGVFHGDGPVDAQDAAQRLAASQEAFAAWRALLARCARRGPVVNPPATWELHGLKPYEVGVYDARGWRAPRTHTTTDAGRLAALATLEAPTGWIRKDLIGGYGYTELFDPPADPADAAPLVARGPLMAQERIQGDAVRAYVLEGRVLGAAEIVSQTPGEVDSRRGEERVRRIDLPGRVAERVQGVVSEWGMTFAAVDLMRDARAGEWVLLECNSAPFFVEFERRTGIDLCSPIADHLLRRRRRA